MTVEALTHDEDTAAEAATTEAAPASAQAADAPEVTEPTETTASPASSSGSDAAAPAAEEAPKPKRGRPKAAAASTAKKTRTVELILTVTGTADGEWQAELKNGSKWVAKGLEIPAAAVSRAAKELHADLSGPIDEVINQAREAQAAKVAQLEAELEAAKAALAELDA
ncbi:DUF6319 family protein [Amycolatopsis carbonis]|uniref:DUF6319 family protein n=1 Tax=Amycolatopsis carbonis TaxID=715471 RepID=A0A9Y2MWK5_9PSEU|nr:DUF6319 family protein [Amycolatopsis sp. 2-15]WIX81266.1 DUF6319 family protein [Amycolatopsis sp. 2-15]